MFALGVLSIAPGCSLNAQTAGYHRKGEPDIETGAVNRSCAAGGERTSYLRIHGRLAVYNGGYPNLRLWHIGTHHLFGIYSDQADLNCLRGGVCGGDEVTKLPSKLEALMKVSDPFEYDFYGDFEIRLLETYRHDHMQSACIVDARNLVRRRRSD